MTDQGNRVVPAGWYEDPGSTEQVRWWNGVEWTQHVRQKPTTRTPASNGAYEQLALVSNGSEFAGTGSTTVGTLEAEHEPEPEVAAAATLAAAAVALGEPAVSPTFPWQPAATAPTSAAGADEPAFGALTPSWQQEGDTRTAALYRPHTSTGSVWLVALSPILVVIVTVIIAYIYFYVAPEPLILLAGLVPYLLSVLWAFADVHRLREWGNRPPHAAWSFLGPLVYLVARRIRIPGWGPLITFGAVIILTVGLPSAGWAVGAAAPLSTALTIQGAVRSDLIKSGHATNVTCPAFAEATTVGTLYTCDATLSDGTTRTVWVSIDSPDGAYSYALALS